MATGRRRSRRAKQSRRSEPASDDGGCVSEPAAISGAERRRPASGPRRPCARGPRAARKRAPHKKKSSASESASDAAHAGQTAAESSRPGRADLRK